MYKIVHLTNFPLLYFESINTHFSRTNTRILYIFVPTGTVLLSCTIYSDIQTLLYINLCILVLRNLSQKKCELKILKCNYKVLACWTFSSDTNIQYKYVKNSTKEIQNMCTSRYELVHLSHYNIYTDKQQKYIENYRKFSTSTYAYCIKMLISAYHSGLRCQIHKCQ